HATPELLVVGVRTTRRYRHIEGEVSSAQIERVAQRLRKADPGQLRIVVTHQPAHVVHPDDEKHLLRGRERALNAWAQAGMDLILRGHILSPSITRLDAELVGGLAEVWSIKAGTATTSRIRHDSTNSVGLIRYGLEGTLRFCTVEQWAY